MTDFNKMGETYELYAEAPQWDGYGVLKPGAVALLNGLRAEIQERQKLGSNDAKFKRILRLIARLDGTLHHSRQALIHLHDIVIAPRSGPYARPAVTPPVMMCLRPRELAIELESILFHAAAALDSAAKVIEATIVGYRFVDSKGKSKTTYFSNVQHGVKQALKSDARAQLIISLLDECSPHLSDVLLSVGRKTMRNFIAHEGSAQELIDTEFTIHWLQNGAILRFDQELYGRPMMSGLRSVVWTATYFVAKASAILLTWDKEKPSGANSEDYWKVGRETFEPTWASPFINWRDYLSTSPEDQVFTVTSANESDVTLKEVRLNKSVLEKATFF
ncbi:MAG: hypothetical protein HXX15_08760 [Rhodopseudomonas sp.]|uniref:hypothetical protein n=1 Tax=Rhodopseudomonas sp. TaxID=1078 RepID=UPI0018531ED1|nr:hypothetical protein [Rhodopseudomonas sp.]NVN86169.1 hypothetical protein [Rhodopseudomonas sp.]